MNLSFSLFCVSGCFYFLSALSHTLSFCGIKQVNNHVAFGLMRIGFLFATFFFVSEAVDSQSFLPVLNFSQAMGFFAWTLAFVYLVFLSSIQIDSFGLVLSPVLFLLTLMGALTFDAGGAATAVPQWSTQMNPSFKLHIMSAFFAYASFTLSFTAGILYLIQNRELKSKQAGAFYHKLPSLVELEALICRPLYWGTPLLFLTLMIGFFWSKSVYGEYWIWDPKTIATLVTAFMYLGIIFFKLRSFLRGKQIAVLSLLSFAMVLLSFVIPRFIEGSHNYLK